MGFAKRLFRKLTRWKPKCNEDYEWMDKEYNKYDLDLFISTHKVFTPPVRNVAYKIVYGNRGFMRFNGLPSYKCVSDDVLDDRFYSELYMLRNLPNIRKHKYVGMCHYRRYFSFMDKIPDLEKEFSENDVILPTPYIFKKTIRGQYETFHNVEDYDLIGEIIKKDFSEYYEYFEDFSNGHTFFPCNMFIMKRDDFDEYIKFLFGVLEKYVEIVGTDIEKRILDNKDKYLKKMYPNDTVEYQYRIGGYLGERLTNVFIFKHFKRIKTYKINLTELKYKV